jgi:hypothetical protein
LKKQYNICYKENETYFMVLKFSRQCPLFPSVEGKLEEFCSVWK